jgi:hypothetical protein
VTVISLGSNFIDILFGLSAKVIVHVVAVLVGANPAMSVLFT